MIEIRVGQLARILGVHRNTIGNWIKSGDLPARPTVGKRYIIKRDEFTHFLQSKGIAAQTSSEILNSLESPSPANGKTLETPTTREVPMADKPVGSVMVVGGGIAGIQASLDLADSGYFVHLLEKSPGIGGGMAKLDKTFPTNDCAM